MNCGRGMILLVVLIVCAGVSMAQRVDIYSGLASGSIWADFRGNGDASVMATIGRAPGGPTEVVIPTGAVFHVAAFNDQGLQQYGGGGNRGGGGGLNQRQAMSGSSTTLVSLAMNPSTTILLPAVCMDYGRPEPRLTDRMAIAPPNEWQTSLASAIEASRPSQPVIQLAMWAAANNVAPVAVDRYLTTLARARTPVTAPRDDVLAAVWDLLEAAGFDPSSMKMFQATG